MTVTDKPLGTVIYSVHSPSINTNIYTIDTLRKYLASSENEWGKNERETWTRRSLAQLTATGNARGGVSASSCHVDSNIQDAEEKERSFRTDPPPKSPA